MVFAAGLALAAAQAQSWAPLKNQPSFHAGTALLLTDGTVMVQDVGAAGAGTGLVEAYAGLQRQLRERHLD